MVETQLRRRGLRDARVLEAFLRVPRHRFVDPALDGEAYADRALPIGFGQTISQPYMVALMTCALAPERHDRVLEVGTGSGYQAAILSRLVHTVFTIERIAPLAERARALFRELDLTNVIERVGDGSIGWISYAPYQGIIVTAGAPEIPPSLLAQLADGGRLVVPAGSRANQSLLVVTRRGEHYERREETACVFVPLLGKEGWGDD
ncbi:MAG: protein-L-isoaspartate(D-aspartate) O-methyltransferase [Candidatus Eisenbacteria sp.]|nr:protein-L-isoaspartate(D-aspartate) O-methyltransferase [Candidatus Eisenbacteria bacterium]